MICAKPLMPPGTTAFDNPATIDTFRWSKAAINPATARMRTMYLSDLEGP